MASPHHHQINHQPTDKSPLLRPFPPSQPPQQQRQQQQQQQQQQQRDYEHPPPPPQRQQPVFFRFRRDDSRLKGYAKRPWILFLFVLSITTLLLHIFNPLASHLHHRKHRPPPAHINTCPQVNALSPSYSTSKLDETEEYIKSDEYKSISAEFLGQAIRIPTVSYDDMLPVGTDPRWDIFPSFLEWVEKTFPLVHAKLEVKRVNKLNMLYIWKGTDESLKPTLLMAHYDVVPVDNETWNDWTEAPFSGRVRKDNQTGKEWIYGRGSSDDKNRLVAIFESVELLLKSSFTPRRTVIMAFGCQEESNGYEGAAKLAPEVEKLYGKNGIGMIIDEGSGILGSEDVGWGDGKKFMMVSTGEKGSTDVMVEIRVPGGHSSVPPDSTGIGIMGEFVTMVEANPFHPYIAPSNPFLGFLHCGREHAPEFPQKLGKLLDHHTSSHSIHFGGGGSNPSTDDGGHPHHPHHPNDNHHEHRHPQPQPSSSSIDDEFSISQGKHVKKHRRDKLAKYLSKDIKSRYLITTSSAVTVIKGGIKSNALPESVTATINCRINIGENVKDVKKHFVFLAKQLAKKYDLTVSAFTDEGGCKGGERCVRLWTADELEPAPVSPVAIYTSNSTNSTNSSSSSSSIFISNSTDDNNAKKQIYTPYTVLSGVVRDVYGSDIILTPGIMGGNTDTRWYWNLTRHIFRVSPIDFSKDAEGGDGGIHTVNERISVQGHVNAVFWFWRFLRIVDGVEMGD